LADITTTIASMPKVTIVTPSFNQASFLEETILSVINQDYPNIEYVIIDGGSKDGCLDIIRKYEDRLAYWVSEPDRGQSDAVNKGWRRSTGDILAWINSDDYYEPNAVQMAVKLLRENPQSAMVCGSLNIVDDKNRFIRLEKSTPVDFKAVLRRNGFWTIQQTSVFIRREVIADVGMLDEDMHLVMDLDLWTRIGLKYEIYYSDFVFANFRDWKKSKTNLAHETGSTSGDKEVEIIRSRYLPRAVYYTMFLNGLFRKYIGYILRSCCLRPAREKYRGGK
jgi:glycosyltransferase involved in cell wall biosynthesis